jgi:hypothetical protein
MNKSSLTPEERDVLLKLGNPEDETVAFPAEVLQSLVKKGSGRMDTSTSPTTETSCTRA